MKKRGQVSVFMILGVIILILVGLFFYFNSAKTISQSEAAKAQSQDKSDSIIVKSYVETCLKRLGDKALFDRMGLQGGFIDPEGNIFYSEPGITGSPIFPSHKFYDGEKVPVYLDATCNKYCAAQDCSVNPCICTEFRCSWSYDKYIPDESIALDILSLKLENYLKKELSNCVKLDIFKDKGTQIIPDENGPQVEVGFNDEHTSVVMNFYMELIKDDSKASVESFRVDIPIRFKALYLSAVDLIENIEQITDTPFLPEVPYNLSKDCADYDKNKLTNVYVKNSPQLAKIVQFVDYSSYYQNYLDSYFFQIALNNVDISGFCAG
jgi:hypothetical protein